MGKQKLWRPSLGRKADSDLDSLLETIELMVREGQEAELRNLITDLKELITAIQDLIAKMQTAGKGYAVGQKAATMEEALSQIRARIPSAKPGEKKAKKTVVEEIAQRLLAQGG